MDWKKLLAYISGSVGEDLLLRNEHLVTENRILRAQIKGHLRLTDGERRTLAEIGKKLGRKALGAASQLNMPRGPFQLVTERSICGDKGPAKGELPHL